ncbi:two-component system sensor histidine kinase NtrB [Terriglobus roseus]|uniref:histidine kinase n=1 Tax=Terriglobus roseus TaxID=392734 RepID=A0A1G7ESA3_9BACT|nr:PAS domain S-box protein [Terriglobus roseus]SDE66285.1 PAS domain S-box-containing protein [Terriglobus roseus]
MTQDNESKEKSSGQLLPVDAARANSLLAAIVESSDDAIISKDLDGTITSWNAAAERIFGFSSEEIVGKSILTLIPEDLQDEEKTIIARLRRGERIEHFETTRVAKSGKLLSLSLTISPVRDASGTVVGASKIARDISERKEFERRLVETEKIVATGRMAATIAHEINNPLEAVVNLIYLARLSPTVNEQVREYLRLAEQEIERVSLIARQTLGYFRETAVPVDFPVSVLLDEVLTVYGAKLAYSGIDVHRDYQPAQRLTMRKGELTQLFSNLVANAIDAMPLGGDLSVSVAPEGQSPEDGVRVQMADTGTGISEELLEKIFEPFFTTKEQRGTGIGLWLSRQFVEDHRGSIAVTSSTDVEDHGTTFRIFLPYANGLMQDAVAGERGNA